MNLYSHQIESTTDESPTEVTTTKSYTYDVQGLAAWMLLTAPLFLCLVGYLLGRYL